MKIGVAGLGLIGGSFCKAYKIDKHTVLGYDINKDILEYACLKGDIDGIMTKENIKTCDLILIAITPKEAINFLNEFSTHFAKDQLVIDCCGTKKSVCNVGFELSSKYGFLFIGGHPMAGTQFSGYKNSRADMFKNATMALVPPVMDDINITERAKTALLPAGFKHFSVWKADEHDKVIAFSSQLAHVVSNAYVKSPSAKMHKGLSAGSYKDMTRVAKLNPCMWSELFLENQDNLLIELETLINELNKYKNALKNNNKKELFDLLKEGCDIKQEVDGID